MPIIDKTGITIVTSSMVRRIQESLVHRKPKRYVTACRLFGPFDPVSK